MPEREGRSEERPVHLITNLSWKKRIEQRIARYKLSLYVVEKKKKTLSLSVHRKYKYVKFTDSTRAPHSRVSRTSNLSFEVIAILKRFPSNSSNYCFAGKRTRVTCAFRDAC